MFKPKTSPAIPSLAPTASGSAPVAAPAAGWFAGFGDVKAAGGAGNYIQPGTYIVQIDEMIRQVSDNPQRRGSQLVIARFTVQEVLTAFEADPTPPSGWGASNKAGESVVWIQNLGYPHAPDELRMSNVKSMLLAVARCDSPELVESDFTPAEWIENLTSATEPPGKALQGYRLKLVATKKLLPPRGNRTGPVNFTPLSWYPHASKE